MYNRYVPQPDGSYCRRPVPESRTAQGCCTPPPEPDRPKPDCRPQAPDCGEALGIGEFLRKLLPRGLDLGDLMIILLLLIISGDCQEDQNTALLTLVLYLFL